MRQKAKYLSIDRERKWQNLQQNNHYISSKNVKNITTTATLREGKYSKK
jgi:hypothetical protein